MNGTVLAEHPSRRRPAGRRSAEPAARRLRRQPAARPAARPPALRPAARPAARSARHPAGELRPVAAARPARPAHPAREHRVIFWSVAILSLIGLPVVLSASSVTSLLSGASPYSDFVRQCLFMAVAVAAGTIASRVQPEVVRRFRFVLPVAVLGLLVVVFLPGIGHYAGGSSRWIGVGPIQVQPSELMKLAIVVFAADLLARRGHRSDHWRAVVTPLLVILAVSAMLILAQPDLGTAIVIACITFALMFSAGVPLRVLSGAFVLVAAPGAYLALHAAYRRDRLLSFVNPFAHASGTGYQVVQSLATLGMGGLRGNGIGASAGTWGFLPNAHTDFVFAVVGGNLGLLGSLVVLGAFAAFGWAGLRVAAREQDAFTRYLAVGVTCWILCQAVINVGGVIDALPVTGIPLPFVSYGGSALVVAMTGAGLLLGIARRQRAAVATDRQRAATERQRAATDRWRTRAAAGRDSGAVPSGRGLRVRPAR